MRHLAAVLLALAIVGCTSGSRQDRADVAAVDQARSDALNRRDLGRYLDLLSHSYLDRGKDFASQQRQLQRTLTAYERISYRPLARKITISGDTATISGDYLLKVTQHGRTVELAGREELRLQREAGGWKIVGGL